MDSIQLPQTFVDYGVRRSKLMLQGPSKLLLQHYTPKLILKVLLHFQHYTAKALTQNFLSLKLDKGLKAMPSWMPDSASYHN